MSKFPCVPSSFNSGIDFPSAPQQRRTQLAQQDLTMGSMGGNIRRPGKSGLSFDLIFRRLQGELQKCKETGVELHNLTAALGEIQDALGGSLADYVHLLKPQNMPPPPLPHSLPPFRMHNDLPPDKGLGHPPPLTMISPEMLLVVEMQAQLQEVQSSLASHVDKIRSLERIFAEQEALKQEMRVLRGLMKARELDMFQLIAERDNDTSRKPSSNFEDEEDGEEDASVITVTTGTDNLERIDEEDEERMEHRDITDEIPEHDLKTDEEECVAPSSHKDHLNPTVQALEKKVESIEALVEDTQEQQTSATVPPPPPPTTIPSLVTPPSSVEIAKEKEAETSPTEILSEWKKSVQVQEDCSEERERLNRAREELEAKTPSRRVWEL
ncbi:hypothetical protein JOM56_002880 [Amanita muscaria]